jgi:glutamine amidotransferase
VSHLVAYVGNEPEHLACALVSARAALAAPAAPGRGGWGLGFVQGGEVLLQKRPRAEGANIDFFTLAKNLKADAFIARGGISDEIPNSAEDTDPFRFRWWLMGSVGSPEGLDKIRDKLLASVPDFLRRNIRGRSPGELFFHLFLAFLHDAGVLESQLLNPEPVARALGESSAFVDRLLVDAGAPPAPMPMVVTNGRCLVARSAGFPIQFLSTTGINDCTVCRQDHALHATGDGRRFSHEALRAVVLEADPTSPARPGWTQVPAGSTLMVDPERPAVIAPVVKPASS